MPPRHAYWTILVDNQPTAFRAHDAEDLLATLNRLKQKHPTATMKWFERGKLWDSRDVAREAGFGQGERRWEGPRPERPSEEKRRDTRQDRPERDDRPRSRDRASQNARSERPRGKSWRPGGEHRDPRQKYKDAKKAKWQRFKQNVRTKWEARQDGDRPLKPSVDRPPSERPRQDARRRDERPPDRPWDNRGPARRKPWAGQESRGDRPPRREAWTPKASWSDRSRETRDDRRPADRRPDQRWSSRGQSGTKPWSGRDQRSGDRPPPRDGWKAKPSWSDRPRDQRSEGRPDHRDRGWRPKGPPRGDRPPGKSAGGPAGEWPSRRPETRDWRERPPRDRERPPASTRPYDKDARPRGSKPFGSGGTKPLGRKPWGGKPSGSRPTGKPFSAARPRGPARPPGRGPRKRRDDE